MKKIIINSLKVGTVFEKELYIDHPYILLNPSIPMADELKILLQKWYFTDLYTDTPPSPIQDNKQVNKELLKDTSVTDTPSTENEIQVIYADQDKILRAEEDFILIFEQLRQCYAQFEKHKRLDVTYVRNIVYTLQNFVKSYKNIMLNFNLFKFSEKRQIRFAKLLHTAILAIAIGQAFKQPTHQLVDLGTAALLHKISTPQLLDELEPNTDTLNESQLRTLAAYSILTYKILKENGFSIEVCNIAIQCHERLNGSGYPRRLTQDHISLSGRILGAASHYIGLVKYFSNWNTDSPHTVICKMLKNSTILFDSAILKVLLQLLSLYPLGSYVELANGAIGVTYQPSLHMNNPTVQIIINSQGEKLGTVQFIETNQSTCRIVREISVQEIKEQIT